jgi:hypothetical protein
MTMSEYLEPYSVQMSFRGEIADPIDFTRTLLGGIAMLCDQAGASLIGHIKCYAHTPLADFHCNLTSLRTGCRCSLDSARPTDGIDLDLVVLVYGLNRDTLADLATRQAVTTSREAGVDCMTVREARGQHHEHA